MEEYPKFMCRAGSTLAVNGVLIDYTSADDADAEASLMADGWVNTVDEIETPTDVEIAARKRGRPPKDQGDS